MAYEQKPESGSLHRNNRKRPDKKDPDYTGTALIGGVEYYIDAWLNEYRSGENQGKKYFGMKFKAKDGGGPGQQSVPQVPADDDIPF